MGALLEPREEINPTLGENLNLNNGNVNNNKIQSYVKGSAPTHGRVAPFSCKQCIV